MPIRGRAQRRLSSRYVKGASLSREIRRELWQIRFELLGLAEPQVAGEAQFNAFLSRPDTGVMLFVDGAQAVQGFYSFTPFPVQAKEGRALIVFSKYWYVRESFQGHPAIMLAAWKALPSLLRAHGVRRIFFATFSAPQSYASLTRTFGRAWTLQEAQTPPFTREVLHGFVNEFAGETWDPQQNLVLDAIPEEFIAKCEAAFERKGAKARQLFLDYEQLNPAWRSGAALPIAMRFDRAATRHIFRRTARRLFRLA